MSNLFFEDVLSAIGAKLNYDGMVNYAGNSNVEKAWEIISKSNPLTPKAKPTEDKTGLAGVFGAMGLGNIEIIK